MRDTSEFPDAIEQAKTNPVKPKPPARSARPDSATPGNHEQDRTQPPRRRPPTAQGINGSGPRTEQATPSTPERPAGPAGTPQARQGGPNNGPRTPNPAYTPRPGGGNAPYQQRTGNGGPAGNGGPVPATANRPPYRPSGNAPQNRQGYPASPASHPVGPAMPNNGSGYSSNRAPTVTRHAPRPAGPPSGAGVGGPHGPARPSGGTHATPPRPARPTPAQRPPAERRVPVVKEKPTGPVSIPPQVIVKDLADLLRATPNEVIKYLIKHGTFASINQVVDYEQAAQVAQDMGFEPSQTVIGQGAANGERLSANEEMIAGRDENTIIIPPVVTIMGHVDHGKTSLLDMIRKTKVAAGEAGGITQHIGAYQVEIHGKKITFLDTPGHEAFTAMRARGAQVTHIAIIVVAADDGVMPQTREAISHAQAAKVPIIIAINKIDKENANPDYVKQQLAEMGVVIEEYGGEVVCVPVSARRGTGIDELLEMILLVAEVQDIRANPNRPAVGAIIEARLEKNTGPMATVLVQQGTLKMGDNFIVGSIAGKVRAMFNDRGKRIQKAPPSTPVSIMGLPEVPQAGDRLEVELDERTAKQRATQEAEKRRQESMPLGQVSLDNLYMQMQEGKVKELNLVLKCDVQGSAEALKSSLSKISEGNETIKVRLIHEGIGNISETDVHLAAASGAIIIGFHVKADGAAQREAQREGVDIRYYDVIYKLTDDIEAALAGMLEPTYREVIDGHAEVVQIFKAGKNLVIAGCRVTDGKMTRSSQVRLMRKTAKVLDGKIASLRRGKDDVREVQSGYECGIVIEEFNEFEVGDILEAYSQERVKPGM